MSNFFKHGFRFLNPNIQWTKKISTNITRVGLKNEFIHNNLNIHKFKMLEHGNVLIHDPVCKIFLNKDNPNNIKYICSPDVGYVLKYNTQLFNYPEKLYHLHNDEIENWLFDINTYNYQMLDNNSIQTSKYLYSDKLH